MSLQLIPDSGNPGILLGKVGPLRVHVAILDQKDDGLPDEAGPVEWYVTSSEYRGDWRGALLEGYADSLEEARTAILNGLAELREELDVALGTAR